MEEYFSRDHYLLTPPTQGKLRKKKKLLLPAIVHFLHIQSPCDKRQSCSEEKTTEVIMNLEDRMKIVSLPANWIKIVTCSKQLERGDGYFEHLMV